VIHFTGKIKTSPNLSLARNCARQPRRFRREMVVVADQQQRRQAPSLVQFPPFRHAAAPNLTRSIAAALSGPDERQPVMHRGQPA
jgi:hypothetical protein